MSHNVPAIHDRSFHDSCAKSYSFSLIQKYQRMILLAYHPFNASAEKVAQCLLHKGCDNRRNVSE